MFPIFPIFFLNHLLTYRDYYTFERTIESERDRTVTIMVLPFMSCGARLPIYALLIPAFFAAKYQAFMMLLIYVIGVIVALVGARLMKSTLFKGDGEVYLMELPPYRMPTAKSLMLHMWDRGRMYLQKAGTVILFTSIILYICNTFPVNKAVEEKYAPQIAAAESALKAAEAKDAQAQEKAKEELSALENAMQSEQMQYTITGRVGKFLEPVFKPLGFDWRITTACIPALAAKEIFVAQMGILMAEGEVDENSDSMRAQLRKYYTPLQAFCVMLFCLLSIPCLATLAVIKRELNSWAMALTEAAALFGLAYVVTLIVYQVGTLLKIGTSMIG